MLDNGHLDIGRHRGSGKSTHRLISINDLFSFSCTAERIRELQVAVIEEVYLHTNRWTKVAGNGKLMVGNMAND